MAIKTLKTEDFTLVVDKYVSTGVQLEHANAAVQVKTNSAGSLTIERSVNARDYSPVDGFEQAVDGFIVFNIVNAVPGLYVRIVSTVEVELCNILL